MYLQTASTLPTVNSEPVQSASQCPATWPPCLGLSSEAAPPHDVLPSMTELSSREVINSLQTNSIPYTNRQDVFVLCADLLKPRAELKPQVSLRIVPLYHKITIRNNQAPAVFHELIHLLFGSVVDFGFTNRHLDLLCQVQPAGNNHSMLSRFSVHFTLETWEITCNWRESLGLFLLSYEERHFFGRICGLIRSRI